MFLPADVRKKIDNIETKIDASVATLSDGTKRNSKTIRWFEYHVNIYIIYKLLKLVGKLFGFYNVCICCYKTWNLWQL